MSRVVMFVLNDVTLDSRVAREAATLRAAGHQVTIIGTRSGSGSGSVAREVRDGVEIVRVPIPLGWRTPWAVVRYPWRFRRRLAGVMKRGFTDGPAGWPRALGWLSLAVLSLPWLAIRRVFVMATGGESRDRSGSTVDWLLWWRFGVLGWARAAARVAPEGDVYHGHDLTGLPAALTRADRQDPGDRPRVVYDSHEIFLESGSTATRPGWARAILATLERRWSRRAVVLLTVNPAYARVLTERLHPRRTVIIHNCPPRWTPPDPPADRLRTATGIGPDGPVVLYHGGFSAHRGMEEMAEALLEPGLESVHAVYLGYGARRQALERLSAEPRFGGRLHVLEAVPPEVLLEWVAGAEVDVIALQPSTLNHRLCTPNKLFESLAAGVPVVVSDFPIMRRIVLDDPDGPLGAVCDPTDPASIGSAIRSILDRPPADRATLRARCLEAAHARWNWETESRGLLDLYADLLPPVGSPPAPPDPPGGTG